MAAPAVVDVAAALTGLQALQASIEATPAQPIDPENMRQMREYLAPVLTSSSDLQKAIQKLVQTLAKKSGTDAAMQVRQWRDLLNTYVKPSIFSGMDPSLVSMAVDRVLEGATCPLRRRRRTGASLALLQKLTEQGVLDASVYGTALRQQVLSELMYGPQCNRRQRRRRTTGSRRRRSSRRR